MNIWEENHVEEKIMQILEDVPDGGHHFGRPFLTAYQLAIEFDRLYPEVRSQTNLPIGGIGAGQRNTFSQYLAKQLSQRIKSAEITKIEGGFLSNQHLKDISFSNKDTVIHSSLTDTEFTLSMFRLLD
jgi:hypothetical protein